MIGDIVTITVDRPYGVDEDYFVKNETGVIVESFAATNQWRIETGVPNTSGWWFTPDEFRPATEDEVRARLKKVLMG